VADDCLHTIICTGHTVNACHDGLCACDPPVKHCASAADCDDILVCSGMTVGGCLDEKCVCSAASEQNTISTTISEVTATRSSEVSTTMVEPDITTPLYATGTCHTHIREYGSTDAFHTEIHVLDGSGVEINKYSSTEQILVCFFPGNKLLTETANSTRNGARKSRSLQRSYHTTSRLSFYPTRLKKETDHGQET
jgi:hypothetical protein